MKNVFVGAAIRNYQNRLLPYKHIDKTPAWRIPGGKVEFGEDLLAAIEREIYEETGLDANVMFLDFSYMTRRFIDGAQWEGHIYKTTLPRCYAGQAKLYEPDKCNALGWFTEEELKTMDYFDYEKRRD